MARYPIVAGLMLLLAGCSTPDGQDEPGEASFEADPTATGPRLWLEVEVDDPIEVTLLGAELGGVFGWSTHLTFEQSKLQLEEATIDEAVLGAAVKLSALKPGDVALAATRTDPSAPDSELDAPVVLATMVFRRRDGGDVPLALARTVVRRRNRSYVGVTTAAGTLKEGGK